MKGREIFKVEGDKINRLRRHCPKCGDGFFLAVHKNRDSCGKCGYTEFKKSSKNLKNIKSEIKTITKSNDEMNKEDNKTD